MAKGIIGTKLGMTQLFKDDQMVPVTLIEAGPCVITQIKTVETDGYSAMQVAYKDVSKNRSTKPAQGHFDKAKTEPKRFVRELRLTPEQLSEYEVGQEITASAFAEGDKARVSGVSKGRGFAGPMKRWGFSGLPASHGAHRVHRAPGSIGASATPSRVLPGKRMAGQMGNQTVTTRNVEVVRVDEERNVIALKGAVPGPSGGLVVMRVEG